MAYFCRVGPNSSNLSGVEARGYRIYRRGTTVRLVWGPIEIVRHRTLAFIWSSKTLYKDEDFGTVKSAQMMLRDRIADRERQGYFRLPPGCRITPMKFASGVIRRR